MPTDKTHNAQNATGARSRTQNQSNREVFQLQQELVRKLSQVQLLTAENEELRTHEQVLAEHVAYWHMLTAIYQADMEATRQDSPAVSRSWTSPSSSVSGIFSGGQPSATAISGGSDGAPGTHLSEHPGETGAGQVAAPLDSGSSTAEPQPERSAGAATASGAGASASDQAARQWGSAPSTAGGAAGHVIQHPAVALLGVQGGYRIGFDAGVQQPPWLVYDRRTADTARAFNLHGVVDTWRQYAAEYAQLLPRCRQRSTANSGPHQQLLMDAHVKLGVTVAQHYQLHVHTVLINAECLQKGYMRNGETMEVAVDPGPEYWEHVLDAMHLTDTQMLRLITNFRILTAWRQQRGQHLRDFVACSDPSDVLQQDRVLDEAGSYLLLESFLHGVHDIVVFTCLEPLQFATMVVEAWPLATNMKTLAALMAQRRRERGSSHGQQQLHG